VAHVVGEIHGRHPARAQLALDGVAVVQSGAQPRGRVGQIILGQWGGTRSYRVGGNPARPDSVRIRLS
jgi:hypothetical protein